MGEADRLKTELSQVERSIRAAEAELASLRASIESFEREVERRLGPAMDRLSALDAEIAAYLELIERHREERIYGANRAARGSYRKRTTGRKSPSPDVPSGTAAEREEKEIRALYRRLARRYHPDLGLSEEDRRLRTEKMAEVNAAYADRSLPRLRALAIGARAPDPPAPSPVPSSRALTPEDRLRAAIGRKRQRLASLQAEIGSLQRHPSVQLSLDVKLALHEGRDLLGEMAADMKAKIARRQVERDYLHSQLVQLGMI